MLPVSGDNFAKTPGAREIAITDSVQGVYKKLVLNEDGSRLLGGILVGDASAYGTLLQFVQNAIAPATPSRGFTTTTTGRQRCCCWHGSESLPDTAQICSCNNVSKEQICTAIQENNFTDIG
jgi:nitrite reductase (NADH) large subunit